MTIMNQNRWPHRWVFLTNMIEHWPFGTEIYYNTDLSETVLCQLHHVQLEVLAASILDTDISRQPADFWLTQQNAQIQTLQYDVVKQYLRHNVACGALTLRKQNKAQFI
jgi:hypothetical protein